MNKEFKTIGDIKQNELRIGNMLNYWIEEDKSYHVSFMDWQDLRNISEDEIDFNKWHNPIPLTEDILLKCGFKNADFGLIIITKNKTQINLVGIDGQWSVGLSGPFGLVQPCFVQSLHQLQNLYFALIGNELEITL